MIITFMVGSLAFVQISSWLAKLWIKRKLIVVFWTVLVFIVMILVLFSAITLFYTNRTAAELMQVIKEVGMYITLLFLLQSFATICSATV